MHTLDEHHSLRIAELVERHASSEGTHPTEIDGVRLFRVSNPVDRVPGIYDPSICVVLGGEKIAYHDGRTHTYGPGRYLCTTMPTPIEAEIPEASPEAPVLGVLIDLDVRPMTELLFQHRATKPSTSGEVDPAGLLVSEWDAAFATALIRVLELLDDPAARELLGPGRLRELFYVVLEGPAGPSIRSTLGGASQHLVPILTFMRDNLDQPLAVEALAERAGMSRAAFDRNFRAVTSLSPLKYLKALRLNDAAMQIAGGVAVADAASRVGYTSPSQFSREFKRHFGTTPRTWSRAGSLDPQALA